MVLRAGFLNLNTEILGQDNSFLLGIVHVGCLEAPLPVLIDASGTHLPSCDNQNVLKLFQMSPGVGGWTQNRLPQVENHCSS